MEEMTFRNLIQATSGLAGRKDSLLLINGQPVTEIRISQRDGIPLLNLICGMKDDEPAKGNCPEGHIPGEDPETNECNTEAEGTGGFDYSSDQKNAKGVSGNGRYVLTAVNRSGISEIIGRYQDMGAALKSCCTMVGLEMNSPNVAPVMASSGMDNLGRDEVARLCVKQNGVCNMWQLFDVYGEEE